MMSSVSLGVTTVPFEYLEANRFFFCCLVRMSCNHGMGKGPTSGEVIMDFLELSSPIMFEHFMIVILVIQTDVRWYFCHQPQVVPVRCFIILPVRHYVSSCYSQ